MIGNRVYILEHGGASVQPYMIERKVLSTCTSLKTGRTSFVYKDGAFSPKALGVYVFTDKERAQRALEYYREPGRWRELYSIIRYMKGKTKNGKRTV